MKKLIGTATYIGNVRGIKTTLGNTPHNLFEDHPNQTPYVETGSGEAINVYGPDWVIDIDHKKMILEGISDIIQKSVEISHMMLNTHRNDVRTKFNGVISILDRVRRDLNSETERTPDIVGTAVYRGRDIDLYEEFRRNPQVLYNTEGFYVWGLDGRQVLMDSDWQMTVTPQQR